jgi:hypothetical protein
LRAAVVDASAFSLRNKPTVCPRVAGTVDTCGTKRSVVTIFSSTRRTADAVSMPVIDFYFLEEHT